MKMYHKDLQIWVEVFPLVKTEGLVYISETGAEFQSSDLSYPSTASMQKANVQAIGVEIQPRVNGSIEIKKQG